MPNSQTQSSSPELRQVSAALSTETISKCAKLIASGAMEWPTDFPVDQSRELENLVRSYRRARLVKLIASCIAAEIASKP